MNLCKKKKKKEEKIDFVSHDKREYEVSWPVLYVRMSMRVNCKDFIEILSKQMWRVNVFINKYAGL